MTTTDRARRYATWVLGAALIGAGVAHLSFARIEFRAQVPSWFPIDADLVVVASGLVEIALGIALWVGHRRRLIGAATATFFVVIFPGNIAQWMESRDGFGLDSDRARFVRLWFQPVLVAWALWATDAWSLLVSRGRRR